mgnify:CR=1 FL=1
MIQHICEIDSDEIVDDKEACDFMDKDQHEKKYKKEWYKQNSGNIKEKYDSEARKKKYQQKKKVKAKLIKRICEKSSEELEEDEEVEEKWWGWRKDEQVEAKTTKEEEGRPWSSALLTPFWSS